MPRTSTARSRPRLHLESLEDRLVPASLPIGFSESVIASGLTNPTTMEIAPDGKLFILEQAGTAEVWQNGTRITENFFADTSLNPTTVDDSGERGLLGIAFDPSYSSNRFVYVYYTVQGSPSHNRISRFTANAAGTQVVVGSEQVLLELNNLSSATNHNGGAIHFVTDGKLYVAVGENANPANSQQFDNLLGKVLRLDVSQIVAGDPPNSAKLIPADNPFVGQVTGINQVIYAIGLRNPYTFDVHSTTGDIYVNDVGAARWEEIDKLLSG